MRRGHGRLAAITLEALEVCLAKLRRRGRQSRQRCRLIGKAQIDVAERFLKVKGDKRAGATRSKYLKWAQTFVADNFVGEW